MYFCISVSCLLLYFRLFCFMSFFFHLFPSTIFLCIKLYIFCFYLFCFCYFYSRRCLAPPFLFPASISCDGAILISFFLSFAADTTNVKRGMYRHVIYSLNISIAFSTLKLLFSRLNSPATGWKRYLYFIYF